MRQAPHHNDFNVLIPARMASSRGTTLCFLMSSWTMDSLRKSALVAGMMGSSLRLMRTALGLLNALTRREIGKNGRAVPTDAQFKL